MRVRLDPVNRRMMAWIGPESPNLGGIRDGDVLLKAVLGYSWNRWFGSGEDRLIDFYLAGVERGQNHLTGWLSQRPPKHAYPGFAAAASGSHGFLLANGESQGRKRFLGSFSEDGAKEARKVAFFRVHQEVEVGLSRRPNLFPLTKAPPPSSHSSFVPSFCLSGCPRFVGRDAFPAPKRCAKDGGFCF